MLGDLKKRDFMEKKRMDALVGKSVFMDEQKREISYYEQEAKILEEEEAKLLQALQAT